MYLVIIPPNEVRPSWHWAVLGASGLAVILLIIFEIYDHITSSPRTYKSEKTINRYMCRWVSSGGRVVIFSRDMSWAGGQMMRDMLFGKAKRNELTIFLEKEIALTDELKSMGARIITYGKLGHVPKSRFTIVDFDKEGARVAVGVYDHGKHVIQEFQNGTHPFFAVAEDMVKFLLKADMDGIS
jgi:hypothetical protein